MDKTTFLFYSLAALVVGTFAFFTRKASADSVDAGGSDVPEVKPLPQLSLPVATSSSSPRGIRNNNPGNIEFTSIAWRGQVGSDGRYAVFDTPVNGIRAMLLEIWDSIERDRDNTIRMLVRQWAPPNENDTSAYVNSVASQINYSADKVLSYQQHAIPLAQAITRHENGINPYTAQQFRDAYAAAGKFV